MPNLRLLCEENDNVYRETIVSIYTVWVENLGNISPGKLKEDTIFIAQMWFVASVLSAEALYCGEEVVVVKSWQR